MPKRTNPFQRLIAEIYRDLSAGWHVEESGLLTDKRTGAQREVDVVVRATVAGHELVLAVECRDRRRPADSSWVEAMRGKHEDLGSSKLILYSSSGFTRPSLLKAEAHGIEAVSATVPRPLPWARWARDCVATVLKYVRPDFSPFIDYYDPSGEACRLEVTEDTLLRNSKDGSSVRVIRLLAHIQSQPRLRETLLDHVPDGAADFYCEFTHPTPFDVVQNDVLVGTFKRLGIGIKTRTLSGPAQMTSVYIRGEAHTLASLAAPEGAFSVLISETESGHARVRRITNS
jgi:hypothetical protein